MVNPSLSAQSPDESPGFFCWCVWASQARFFYFRVVLIMGRTQKQHRPWSFQSKSWNPSTKTTKRSDLNWQFSFTKTLISPPAKRQNSQASRALLFGRNWASATSRSIMTKRMPGTMWKKSNALTKNSPSPAHDCRQQHFLHQRFHSNGKRNP